MERIEEWLRRVGYGDLLPDLRHYMGEWSGMPFNRATADSIRSRAREWIVSKRRAGKIREDPDVIVVNLAGLGERPVLGLAVKP